MGVTFSQAGSVVAGDANPIVPLLLIGSVIATPPPVNVTNPPQSDPRAITAAVVAALMLAVSAATEQHE